MEKGERVIAGVKQDENLQYYFTTRKLDGSLGRVEADYKPKPLAQYRISHMWVRQEDGTRQPLKCRGGLRGDCLVCSNSPLGEDSSL